MYAVFFYKYLRMNRVESSRDEFGAVSTKIPMLPIPMLAIAMATDRDRSGDLTLYARTGLQMRKQIAYGCDPKDNEQSDMHLFLFYFLLQQLQLIAWFYLLASFHTHVRVRTWGPVSLIRKYRRILADLAVQFSQSLSALKVD